MCNSRNEEAALEPLGKWRKEFGRAEGPRGLSERARASQLPKASGFGRKDGLQGLAACCRLD
jgi:hypothetical protein